MENIEADEIVNVANEEKKDNPGINISDETVEVLRRKISELREAGYFEMHPEEKSRMELLMLAAEIKIAKERYDNEKSEDMKKVRKANLDRLIEEYKKLQGSFSDGKETGHVRHAGR